MRKDIATTKERDLVLWFNLLLVGFGVCLLFYYVVLANSIAQTNYRIQILQDKISTLAETNSTLMSQKISKENPVALLEFARANNFVEARNISYIFANKNVAQR
ncbi:MAG: hypothetical protein A3B86_01600 [Candidatus Yanofskybacteria bacterium RIFCSPHIGHO2_02_FULL_38_22b]|uniref:Uncharacterized protein n=1 Tax=Candidatus Yanofskybacteria bacterium RIFCSPHIGHO2_02_FULL_38_22b TaxID=1802673 RepID=A0A1F8F2S1_9BACT|nr:MAG: hypothetical protein A3B86_01600 [Candidatus Yanofskybacteria bacterium RIFCSPHIGHO2_02_FULL_38_22b]OGN19816.1 MAG: hypothetical protein A2910_02030 [Candidatus Yanofskybacteria bacterium RIFCSPLOWO2_01_FULL_39_28]